MSTAGVIANAALWMGVLGPIAMRRFERRFERRFPVGGLPDSTLYKNRDRELFDLEPRGEARS